MENKYLNIEDIRDNIVIIKINKLYKKNMSDLQLYEVTRGYWKRTLQSVEKYNIALAVVNKKIIEVYVITKWQKSGTTPMKTRGNYYGIDRIEFIGEIANNTIRNRYIHKDISKLYIQGEANPVKTFDAYQTNKKISSLDPKTIKENLIEDTLLNCQLISVSKIEKKFEYSKTIKPRNEPILNKGIWIYKRDKQVALNALNHANYKCENNTSHYCFLRKDQKTPYTEAHHLIPMAYQKDFDNSIDIEENIVSLCSSCHNEIHYGSNAKTIISKLYKERKKMLEDKNIKITLQTLLSYYNII